MKVSDVMSATPITIGTDAHGQEAAARMLRHAIRHLVVVDGAGKLAGIVTDRDLRHYLLSPTVMPQLGRVPVARLLEQARLGDIMTWPVFVTTPDTDFVDAVAVMRERRVGALPVLDGPRVVGIVTETDLLRRIVAADTARTEPAAADDVMAIVVSYP
jgi:acetoin utilization protein AcuB